MANAILWLRENGAAAPRSRRRAVKFDAKSGRMVTVEDDLGNPVIERLPAQGHEGQVTHATVMRGRRYVEFLKFDGTVFAAPITGAAAAVIDTDKSHQEYVFAKARHEGWIEKHACPVDAVMSGQIKPQRLVAFESREALAKGERCPRPVAGAPPCAHYIAEEAARKARNVDVDRKRAEAARTDAARNSDRSTEALLKLAESIEARAAAAESMPPSKPEKGGK